MTNNTRPLPNNQAVLERLLDEANRIIDWLEPIHATDRFRAEQIQRAGEDPLSVVPMLGTLRSTAEDLRKHMALGGPAPGVLAPFIDQDVLARAIRVAEPARAVLRSIAQDAPITKLNWLPAAKAIRSHMECEAKFLDMVKELRQRIVEKLTVPAEAPARAVADKTPDNPAKKSAACRAGLPRGDKLFRFAKAIQRGKAAGLSQTKAAIDFTEGDETKAQSLLRQLRRYRELFKPVVGG